MEKYSYQKGINNNNNNNNNNNKKQTDKVGFSSVYVVKKDYGSSTKEILRTAVLHFLHHIRQN